MILSGGETESLGTAASTGLLYQPQMIGDGDVEKFVFLGLVLEGV
jgi:hypothetical protein